MDMSGISSRHAQRLVQVGVLLFLCALFVGLAVSRFAVPRVGLSVHLLGLLQGLFLMVMGLLWPRLMLGPVALRLAFWLLVYGCLAAWVANLMAAVWGAGSTMIPMAAGAARGSSLQEALIVIGLRTAALSLIAALALILWGTRRLTSEPRSSEAARKQETT